MEFIQQELIENKIKDIVSDIYHASVMLNDTFNKAFPKETNLISLEVYYYLSYLTIHFLQKHNVDENIRRIFNSYAWGLLEYSKRWTSLNLAKDEIDKFLDNRTENYLNIQEDYIELTEEYFIRITEYQTQLFSEIIINNKLSYYNPVPKKITDYSPIHLDLFVTGNVKLLIQEFIISYIIPLTKEMEENYWNSYFFDKSVLNKNNDIKKEEKQEKVNSLVEEKVQEFENIVKKSKFGGLFLFGDFLLFFIITFSVWQFLDLKSNKLGLLLGVIIASIVCIFLAIAFDRFERK